MAALLRSGKLLRLVSGFATRQQQQQQQQQPFPSSPGAGDAAGGGGSRGTGTGGGSNPAPETGQLASDRFDCSFGTWSLHHLQSALPAASDASGHLRMRNDEEDEDAISIEDVGHNITKEEVRALLRGVCNLDASSPARHSQSVLVLRLCGATLEADEPDPKERTALANEAWTRMEEEMGMSMTVEHYNALLTAYADNGHKFCPEHMRSRLEKSGIKPNKETFKSLLDRYCQEGNMEGANSMLKAIFNEHQQLPLKQKQPKEVTPVVEERRQKAVEQSADSPEANSNDSHLDSPFILAKPATPQQQQQQEQQEVPIATTPVVVKEAQNTEQQQQQQEQQQEQQQQVTTVMQAVPMVQIFNPQTQMLEYHPLLTVCQMLRSQGRFWELERLLVTSQGAYTPDDRRSIYLCTLQSYADRGLDMAPRAASLASQLREEGLDHEEFGQFHELFNQMTGGTEAGSVVAPNRKRFRRLARRKLPPLSSSSSSCPTPTPSGAVSCSHEREINSATQHSQSHKVLKKALAEKDIETAYRAYQEIEKSGKHPNVTESSTLVELLANADRVSEASAILDAMLDRNIYPMPKIFRYLLNRLAALGDVATITQVGARISPRVKKEVSFDNRLCNAYLAAGRGGDFLGLLEQETAVVVAGGAQPEDVQALKDKFPRGGAMGLLECNPDLAGRYEALARRFADNLGYVAPANVLWTFHFINGRHDLAAPLWEAYVKDCPQIMFQKICQTARTRQDADMVGRLVDLLRGATVTGGAQGIALSCLLDVLVRDGRYREALARLTDAVERGGVRLEDINRTALTRLKSGLEGEPEQGGGGGRLEFPYPIPKKRTSRRAVSQSLLEEEEEEATAGDQSRCLTPINDE